MWEAISRRPVELRPPALPNGTGAVGTPWVRGWRVGLTKSFLWRCLAASFMQEVFSGPRAAAPLITLPNGTAPIGAHWAQGWITVCTRWQCRVVTFMRGACLLWRAAARSIGSLNGTGT